MNRFNRIIAVLLAVMSLFFCGCNSKTDENQEPEILPTVRPYNDTEETGENIGNVYTMDSNMNIVSPDGTVYSYYTSQNYISFFSDFNLYENMKNYLGYVEGQLLTGDIWNELGFASYEDYKTVNGDFEYGIYGIRNIPGEEDTQENPRYIMVYFYDKDKEKTYAESQDETIMKSKTVDFYRKTDEETEIGDFNYRNCSAFALTDGSLITDGEIRVNGGIREDAEVSEFIKYMQTAPRLSENRIDDEYYSYLYNHFYNKSTNKFNDSPEYEEAKKGRQSLKLVGIFEDNNAFGIKFGVEKYGDYGYSVNIDEIDYVISDEWVEKLLRR